MLNQNIQLSSRKGFLISFSEMAKETITKKKKIVSRVPRETEKLAAEWLPGHVGAGEAWAPKGGAGKIWAGRQKGSIRK